MTQLTTKVILGDALNALKKLPASSIDLIITSPPYADQRTSTYGGIKPNEYVDWFMPIAKELHRVLRPEGTFVLNIKEKVVEGERHTYVLELIVAMRAAGWLWTEEFMWHKKNSHPGKWPNRFRDGWERLLQFNKQRKFSMYQDAVMVPVGDWHKTRLKKLSETDLRRDESKVGSGFGKNISHWVGRELVYPNNVLYLPTESSNKNHSAVFPKKLPEWFIKLFTQEGDWVLDPFLGSGTTSLVSCELKRNSIGIDILKTYIDASAERLIKEGFKPDVIRLSETDSIHNRQRGGALLSGPFQETGGDQTTDNLKTQEPIPFQG